MSAVNWIVRRVFTVRSRTRGFAAIAVAWVLTVGLWPVWLGIWLEDDPRWQSRIRYHLREDLQPVLDWLFGPPRRQLPEFFDAHARAAILAAYSEAAHADA